MANVRFRKAIRTLNSRTTRMRTRTQAKSGIIILNRAFRGPFTLIYQGSTSYINGTSARGPSFFFKPMKRHSTSLVHRLIHITRRVKSSGTRVVQIQVSRIITFIAFSLMVSVQLLLWLFRFIRLIIARRTSISQFRQRSLITTIRLNSCRRVIRRKNSIITIHVSSLTRFFFLFQTCAITNSRFNGTVSHV